MRPPGDGEQREALTVERYRKFNTFLRDVFGEKVFRVGLCGGFTCPNRDGTLGVEGCIFCNPAIHSSLVLMLYSFQI